MFINYKSIHSFCQSISIKIEREELDQALLLVSQFVEKIITEPLTVSQGFGSSMLDNLCQQIGRVSLNSLSMHQPTLVKDSKSLRVVYVVTKLQKSGGHTRFIQDLISANPGSKHIILSTELLGSSDIVHLDGFIGISDNIEYELSSHREYITKLKWLQSRLLDIKPSKVYLVNHHQDSVAVAAIQQSMGLSVIFCHHGDHHLSLGVYLPNVSHIDLHVSGYHYCRHVLGINNSYLPLVTKDLGNRPKEKSFLSSDSLITCTVGRANKIEPPYFIDYCEVIPRLLKITKGRHIHIGWLTPWALIKIRFYMMLNGVKFNRFKYISWVPSIWRAQQEYKIDLFISSFPYVGILTLIEAMGSGTPVVIHKHISSRILSGVDVAYKGVPTWRFPEELFDICKNLTTEKLMQMAKQSRAQYEKFHDPKFLKLALQAMDPPKEFLRERENYELQNDEIALWVCRQNTLKNFIIKNIYRLIKRLIR